MQHPDEGTIHSWLDGALSAEEAARVEAHVKECSECAAAVAEARGFIAGASRILTALDNAPRGVIPAAAPKKRIDPWVLRVAATVLVVAAGTLVVVRNQGENKQTLSAYSDSVNMRDQRATRAEQAPAVIEPAPMVANEAAPKAANEAAPKAANEAAAKAAGAPAAKSPVRRAPAIAVGEKAGARDVDSDIAASRNEVVEKRRIMQAPQSAIAADSIGAMPSAPLMRVPARANPGFLAMDMASQPEPLKVVGTPRRIGAKVTLYEVEPGDTVTLTENLSTLMENVVVTSIGSGRAMAEGANKSARSSEAQSKSRADAAAIAKVSDSSRAAAAPPSPAPVVTRGLSAQQPGIANEVHAITWTDSATKNTLTLSGRMTVARLQEIKIRIERERAAAAAAKKNPDP